jgi:hypothetical protein
MHRSLLCFRQQGVLALYEEHLRLCFNKGRGVLDGSALLPW